MPTPVNGLKKGRKKTGGRKKGVGNKFTGDMRDVIENAFHVLGGGQYLVEVGLKDPKIFVALLAKLLPYTIQGHLDVTVTLADALEDIDEPNEDECGEESEKDESD